MESLVTIIVPVYNSARYLGDCVESVLAQTYRHWELILVDDGSQNSTKELCERMCKQDQRIRLFCREHRGVSAARNVGIENARGEYLFFLDSDDTIHPALIETLCQVMGESHVAVAMGGCRNIEKGIFPKPSGQPDHAENVQDKSYLRAHEAMQAFIWNTAEVSLKSIGGNMIRRDALGSVRFYEDLSHGEDTWFMYQLICKGVDIMIVPCGWYYYRRYAQSTSKTYSVPSIQSRYRVWQYIRDHERKNGRTANAVRCENMILNQIMEWYLAGWRKQHSGIKKYVRDIANAEKRQYLFAKLGWWAKLLVWLLLHCGSLCGILYAFTCIVLVRQADGARRRMTGKKAVYKERGNGNGHVGIITFHCADNYGAMLQAYGLKRHLHNQGIEADIVRYEPFFMTGRHWRIPYFPIKGLIRRIGYTVDGCFWNVRMGKAFSVRKRNMRSFRNKYLVDSRQKKLLFLHQLKTLKYSCYIVGSDQIWNPDITGGLRKAYFGAFTNNRKEKVIAYAASIGGVSLPPVYNREFSCLLKCVDVISVREKEAIPYIKSLYEGSVIDVLDPVLLLNKEEWLHIEKQPDRERYIFVYLTEKNMELMTYVKKLSKQKGLSIINLWSSVRVVDKEFIIDYIAGPAEFLGYLHQADYVVTNSFHVVVFSIIYQKKFTAFQHSKLGARINNVLRIHGLEHRLYGTDSLSRIDDVVDWEAVKKRTEKKVRISTEFLLDHVGI